MKHSHVSNNLWSSISRLLHVQISITVDVSEKNRSLYNGAQEKSEDCAVKQEMNMRGLSNLLLLNHFL